MKSISLNMTSVEVKAETRALKCEWTREMAKDLEAFSNIDVSSFERYYAKEMRREMRKNSINKIFSIFVN
jgi:hypothetical protein